MAEWRRARCIEGLVRTFDFPELGAVREVYPHFYHKVRPRRALRASAARAHAAEGRACCRARRGAGGPGDRSL